MGGGTQASGFAPEVFSDVMLCVTSSLDAPAAIAAMTTTADARPAAAAAAVPAAQLLRVLTDAALEGDVGGLDAEGVFAAVHALGTMLGSHRHHADAQARDVAQLAEMLLDSVRSAPTWGAAAERVGAGAAASPSGAPAASLVVDVKGKGKLQEVRRR